MKYAILLLAISLPFFAVAHEDGTDHAHAEPAIAPAVVTPIRADTMVRPDSGTTDVAPPDTGVGITPAYIKIDDIDGETRAGSAGSAGGGTPSGTVYPVIRYDVPVTPEPLTPDFGILLGGGDSEEGKVHKGEILLESLRETDESVERVTPEDTAVLVVVKHNLHLFGFIPVPARITVAVNELAEAEVTYPWWAFLASGKNEAEHGARVVTSLTNALKNRHDALMGAIQNTR